jgi:hypothetical protein
MGRAKTAPTLRRAFSPAFFGLVLFIPWRVGAEESGAAKYGFGRRDARNIKILPAARTDAHFAVHMREILFPRWN